MAGATPGIRSRRQLEIADLFRAHCAELGELAPIQQKAVSAITSCRTEALGGHVNRCGSCGHLEISYNSCRNRHCPKCQGLSQARWTDARCRDLLAVPYHHVVFTVPRRLRPLFLADRRSAFAALLRASADTLLEVAADPRLLGGRIGFLSVLHTWTQKLDFHPHIHCVVPGGGLTMDRTQWIDARPGFFLPVQVLSAVFRGKLLAELERRLGRGHLSGQSEAMRLQLRLAARQKKWIVYSKAPFAGPEQVLRYLGRYTHRIAISNHRLLKHVGGEVTFSWRDRADGDTKKQATMNAVRFLSRFLLHVLPKGFVRIRSYGLLANGQKKRILAVCRALIGQPSPPEEKRLPWDQLLEEATGQDPLLCPACKEGRLTLLRHFEPWEDPRVARPP